MIKVNDEMIRELKKGNREAFEYIFNVYSNKIYYLSMKYTKNSNDSDDCVQEIFLRMLEKIQTFNSRKASFGTWFYRLATNYLIDRQRLEKIHKDCLCLNNETVDKKKDDCNGMFTAELSQVEKLVGEKSYSILVMKIGFEMSFREIAKELNLSDSGVKRAYYEAMTKIKGLYKKG